LGYLRGLAVVLAMMAALPIIMAYAAQPANDNFASATVVASVPYSTSQSTLESTLEPLEPTPCNILGSTVWYTFTPAVTASVKITTLGSSYDTSVAVYTGSSVSSLSQVGCNDNAGGALSSVFQFAATGGTSYRIQIGSVAATPGTLQLKIVSPPASNDDFASATSVPQLLPYSNTQSAAQATLEASEPQPCSVVASTVWYSFTPNQSGVVKINTAGSTYDTVAAVYTGSSLNGLTPLACNDDTGGGLTSAVQF